MCLAIQFLTEAVIDRLIHHAHLLVFNGDSHVNFTFILDCDF
jgi:DNA replication protein DnaC